MPPRRTVLPLSRYVTACVSNAIRNCPLCVMKNCPTLGFMMSVEGWPHR